MSFSLTSKIRSIGFLALLVTAASIPLTSAADVIDVERSAVDPAYAYAFENAEALWESRIQNYSEELPRAILMQLTSLRITASTPAIDGVGGILGQAGPLSVLSFESGNLFHPKTVVVPVTAMMQFDIEDLADLEADGILEKVIFHEMGHALGFGSLWVQNNLIEPLGGIGLVQYTGGKYAIQEYGKDIGSPLVSFVPIEQRGGPGTALSHWFDGPPFFNQVFTPAFKKEVMTGFACDADPDTGALVCSPGFISGATWGSMADLGYEVDGINDNSVDPPRGTGTGRWPKVTGGGYNPFGDNGVAPMPGLRFNLVSIKMVTRKSLGDLNGVNAGGVGSTNKQDPYNLRNQRWVK